MLRDCRHDGWMLRGLALLVVLGTTAGCQPVDERPGTWLRGEPYTGSVPDWSFTDGIEEIAIETRPWYGVRHSTTIWCVAFEGGLYIGSYGDERKAWERGLTHDSTARLGIEGKLYEVTVVPVDDPGLKGQLDLRYNEKYDMEAVFGEDLPGWRYYRVEQSGLYAFPGSRAGPETAGTEKSNLLELEHMVPEIEFGPYSPGDRFSGAFSVENDAVSENFLTHAGTTFALEALSAAGS